MTHHGGNKGTHGHTRPSQGGRTPTYRSWQNMICRCTQPSSPAFKHYQKRGITVCRRWRQFENFLADIGERPEGMTLDRKDNAGDYEPSNVRWATKLQQANNRITNVRFIYEGHSYTLANLARETGQSKDILRNRLCRCKLPWTVEGAVHTSKLPRTMSRSGFYC